MISNLKKSLVFIFVFTSLISIICCSDDEDKTDPVPDPVTVDIKYKFEFGEDMMDMFTINVTYTGSDNKEVIENIISLSWNKELKKVPVPFTAKMKINYLKKEGFIVSKDVYKVGHGHELSYITSDGKLENNSSSNEISIPKANIEKYIDKMIESKDAEYLLEIK